MSSYKVIAVLLVLFSAAWAQISLAPPRCCIDDYCYDCDYSTSTSAYPPPGQASASASSYGNNPSGGLNLMNLAQAGYNQTNGFSSYGQSMNNASGPSASVGSNVFSSATNNNNQTNPVVTADANAGSSGNAAQGAVNNLDQAKSNGNATVVEAAGQSQLYGNGTAVSGNSNTNANANAIQRGKQLKTQPKKMNRMVKGNKAQKRIHANDSSKKSNVRKSPTRTQAKPPGSPKKMGGQGKPRTP